MVGGLSLPSMRISGKATLRFALPIAGLAIAFVFLGPLDLALSYLHFTSLTKERLVGEAEIYIRDRAGGDQMACLYVVQCEGGHAHLELVPDMSALDLRGAKERIWRRRFSDYCSGQSTNFGLQLIPRPGHEAQIDAVSHARWVFFNDRFIPQHNNRESGAFTDQPWERCTPQRAIVR